MILLDTNVLSEIRKIRNGRADPAVAAWSAGQAEADLFLSAISVMEIEKGVLRLARRDPHQAALLRHWLDHTILPSFAGRILPFDAEVARACAALHVPISRPELDAMIAATALVHGLVVATRNTADFEGLGVRLVDPWQGQRVGTGSAPE